MLENSHLSESTLAGSAISGLLPVAKPKGMTSKDVGRMLERKLGKLKMGHVGTLDPIAEGVLPILIGGATKIQDILLELPKVYEFEVSFGFETTTLDCEGEVVSRLPSPVLSRELIDSALGDFRGEIVQEPPLFSAIKFQGVPLYKYARKDRSSELPEMATLARKVFIHEIELIDVSADKCSLRVCCSKGTYVRSIARDLAKKLGTVGTVTKLIRTRSSGIDLNRCVNPEEITSKVELRRSMISLEDLSGELLRWKSFLPGWTKRLMNGQKIEIRQELFSQGCVFGQMDSKEVFDQVLLVNQDGQVFGLGAIHYNPVQTVSVSMKRGLL
jgi:tRNA pseudouridine55 synthase